MKSPDPRGVETVRVLEPLLVSIGLVLAVSYRFFEPIWEVGAGLLTLGLLTGVASVVGGTAYRRSERRGVGQALLITIVVSQPVLLVLWASALSLSRVALAGELVLLFTAVAWAGTRGPSSRRVAVALGFVIVAALPTLTGPGRGLGELPPADPNHQYVFSSYHDLSIRTHEVVAHELQAGGSLSLLPDGRVLLVSGSGVGRLLDFSHGLEAAPIELGLPIDVAAYRTMGRRQPEFYRVFDAVYDDGSLFASYIYWDADADCYALRLAEAEFDGSSVGPWATRFESQPCVARPFMGNTSGGRIALLGPSRLLLSIGTFAMETLDYEGWTEWSDYGKIVELDRDTWHHEAFTTGHRNPEGLLVDGDLIWSTEHGPHGGDELNLIEEGSDYGWPFVSYGTDYGRKTLELGGAPGDHSGFAAPVYSWLPSIGISNLIRVSEGLFPMWRGDLLIGSLSGLGNGHALFRVRLLEGRTVTAERIAIDGMVRDLLQLPGGPLLVWDGQGSVRVVRPADHVFSQCAACHNVRSAQHGIGPDLFGVVDSPVGRHDDYGYSTALQRYGGTWTRARLSRFLERPQREVPGTSMEHEGVLDPTARAEIIQFLSEVSAGRRVD